MEIKNMTKATELTGDELVAASVTVDGKEKAVAIPTSLLKGKKGDQGIQGEKGDKGETGPAGADGENGIDGKDGQDGYVTKEMWEAAMKRIDDLEKKAVEINTDSTGENSDKQA